LKDFNDTVGKDTMERMWAGCDDAIETYVKFDTLYNDVPEEFKDVDVAVAEFHMFPDDKREAILKWLNRKGANR